MATVVAVESAPVRAVEQTGGVLEVVARVREERDEVVAESLAAEKVTAAPAAVMWVAARMAVAPTAGVRVAGEWEVVAKVEAVKVEAPSGEETMVAASVVGAMAEAEQVAEVMEVVAAKAVEWAVGVMVLGWTAGVV